MTRTEIRQGAFTLDQVLTDQECAALVRRGEELGFQFAAINTAFGFKNAPEVRNNDRVIFDDPALAADLWRRLYAAIPPVLNGRQALGLNERFRMYRYDPSQRFVWHRDGAFRRANGESSLLTCMIYLNEDYRGGATLFEDAEVAGRTGMALLFRHELLHEGSAVIAGRKYVLRSDVMYGPVGKFGTQHER